jgi:hypothetical protein
MTLALEWPEGSEEAAVASGLLSDPGRIETLRDLVIVHAGNPDDGCCGIWAGAPVATEDETASPWAWIEPLWLPDTGIQGLDETAPSPPAPVPHHELPEPEIVLTAIQDDEAGQGES